MCIMYKPPKDNFTIIDNNLIEAQNISVYAKLVYIYLASKPAKWIVRPDKVQKDLSMSGSRLTKSYKELIDEKLMDRKFITAKPSEYTLYHRVVSGRIPLDGSPSGRIPLDTTLINTNLNKTESINSRPSSANASDKRSSHDSLDVETGTPIAKYLLEKILIEQPSFRKPHSLNGWAKDIGLAIRIDKRSEQELADCIDWIYSEPSGFWIPNVKSGKKLRKQYDMISSRAKQQGRKKR